MDYKHVWVAIIAGGQGTRLFPISHTERPKQFCQLNKEDTFIQAAISNFVTLGVKPTQIVVITTSDNQTKLAKAQTLNRGVLSQNIYQIKPDFGYAGAMVKAAEFIYGLDDQAIIINTPSDQYLLAGKDFVKTIENGVSEATRGSAVIIGAKVNDIVTAMGCGHALYKPSKKKTFEVTGFVEKPDMAEADKIMRQGNSACNTGINIWKAQVLLSAVFKRPRKDPELVASDIIKGLGTDELMQKLGKLRIAVGNFDWHDCGTLKSLYEISKKTPNHKNASLGDGSFERNKCRRSLLYAAEGMELRVTGAEDDAVIFTTIDETPIIVVAKLEESQRIKALAEDYTAHEDFLTDDFSFGARNNIVLGSNISDETIVGFVGVSNYAVYVHKRSDSTLEAVVSQQLTKE